MTDANAAVPDKPLPPVAADTEYFWNQCRSERFMIQRCQRCGAYQFYPRSHCSTCHHPELDWCEASGRGTVKTHTVVYRAPSAAFQQDVPYVLALVDLEEGVRVMLNVIGCAPEAVHAGMPIHLVYQSRGAAGDKMPQAQALVPAD